MKLILILLFPLFSYSQGINNFSLDNAEILWTKTFETNLSFDQFSKAVKQSGLFDKIETIDSSLSGRTINITPDHKGAGYNAMNTPAYLLNDNVKAFAVITYGSTTYTVLLKRITMVSSSDINAGILSQKMGEESRLELYAANSGIL